MGRSGGGMGGGSRGGGGFSGGGRSSGGFSGGGRSSGGFSGGGSRGRSGGGRSGSPPPSGPNIPHGSRPLGGFRAGPSSFNIPHFNSGGGGGGNGGWNGNNNGGSGCATGCARGCFSGCLTTIGILGAIVALIALVVVLMISPGSTGISKSTVEREKLPASVVHETAYYTDTAGWITNAGKLERGMKSFFRRTGVQPYLYIEEGYDNPTTEQLQKQAEQLYTELFTDEGHFLLVFYDNTDRQTYTCGYTAGSQAKTIMDNEAISILGDYLDKYYPSDMTEEEFFSETFADTGERIMTVTKSPLVPVCICATVIMVAALGFVALQKRREQREREQRRTEEILKTPLEKFGDQPSSGQTTGTSQSAEDLAKKYEQDQ